MKIYKTYHYYIKADHGAFNITISGKRLLNNAYGLLDKLNNSSALIIKAWRRDGSSARCARKGG